MCAGTSKLRNAPAHADRKAEHSVVTLRAFAQQYYLQNVADVACQLAPLCMPHPHLVSALGARAMLLRHSRVFNLRQVPRQTKEENTYTTKVDLDSKEMRAGLTVVCQILSNIVPVSGQTVSVADR